MSATRSARGRVETRFFFEPRDLCREATDLRVKFFDLALVCGDQIRSAIFLIKERRQFFYRSVAPVAQLRGMNFMLGGKLRQ